MATSNPNIVAGAAGPIRLLTTAGVKCLDVTGGQNVNGASVQVWECNGNAQQQWRFSNGHVVAWNGMCLDVPGGSAANGTRLQIWTCNGSSQQNWTYSADLELIGIGGKCLDDTLDGGNGSPVQIYSCFKNPAQTWYVSPKSPLHTLVWYENDNLAALGRPAGNGGWWLLNPNNPGVVPAPTPNTWGVWRTATPILGLYNSADPAIIKQHAAWLSSMGATGVIIDWTNLNWTTISNYSSAVYAATDALMAEFSQSTSAHPALEVVLAIRIDDSGSLVNY